MRFLDKLAELRSSSCEQLPTPELAVMARTVARLRRAGIQEKCLQVGETVPDFEFLDQENNVRRLYEVLKKGPAVLNFFRGFWCQFCRTEIEAYEKIQNELQQMDCAYFAISPQKPDTPAYQPGNYQLVFDRGNRIARQFGIVYPLHEDEKALFESWGLRLDQVNDCNDWELPIPATFVVCRDRRIGYEHVDVDFRARCCPEQLIEELRSFA